MKNRTRNFKLSLVACDVTIGGYKSGNLCGKCQFFAEPVTGTYEMGKVIAGLCLMTSVCLLLHQVSCTPAPTNVDGAHRQHRPLVRFLPRTTNQYGRMKSDFSDFIVDDDDLFELAKRQISDDYGHLRFGKREEQFDDYGHMRFGRSSASE